MRSTIPIAVPLHDFHITEKDRYELETAAWLHDCGKVVTPEYVMDKATKLETIHDRIHTLEARFEVLRRDAQIEYLQACASRRMSGTVRRRQRIEGWSISTQVRAAGWRFRVSAQRQHWR